VSLNAAQIAALRDREFPVTRELAWLNTAATGLLPACNVAAQTEVLAVLARGGTATGQLSWWNCAEQARASSAELLACDPRDVALLTRTGEGIGLAATGMAWKPGDEVILHYREFPSAVYPWRALTDKGVIVKFVRGSDPFRYTADDVAAAMSDRTRVVCLSLVNPYDGFRAPLEAIGQLCAERGSWLVVDAAQAMGTIPVRPADLQASLVSAHGYKGLCSGHGISVCYVSPALRAELTVGAPGWKSVGRALEVDLDLAYDFSLAADARRYEGSIQSLPALAGLAASIGLLNGIGIENIASRVAELTEAATEALSAKGYPVVSSRLPGETSAIVSAQLGHHDPAAVQARLLGQGVVCSIRDGRLRVATHVFNNHADIVRLADALPSGKERL
jgi:cysteine desulfurase/selenocysteine lyase